MDKDTFEVLEKIRKEIKSLEARVKKLEKPDKEDNKK